MLDMHYVFWGILIGRIRTLQIDFFMHTQTKEINKLSLFLLLNKLNNQKDLKGQPTVLLCWHLADPATFLA